MGMFVSKISPCLSFFLLSHFCVFSFPVSVFLPLIYFLRLLSFSLSLQSILSCLIFPQNNLEQSQDPIATFSPPQSLRFRTIGIYLLGPPVPQRHLVKAPSKSFIPESKSEKQPLGSPLMKPIQMRTFGFVWAHQAFTGHHKCHTSLTQACFFSWDQVRLCSFSFVSPSDATLPLTKVKWVQNQTLILHTGLCGTDHSHEVFIFLGFKKKKKRIPLFPLS